MNLIPWEDLLARYPEVKTAMAVLGNAGPIIRGAQIKGWSTDEDGGTSKSYYTSADLLDLAEGMKRVAGWLDAREQLAEIDAKASNP